MGIYESVFGTSTPVGALADVLSIAGFCVTVYVANSLRTLKRRFLYRARLPSWITALRDTASRLNVILQSFDQEPEQIQEPLAVCLGTLRSIETWSARNERAEVNGLIQKIMRVQSSEQISKSDVRRIYTDILILMSKLENSAKDLRWSDEDG